MPRSAEQNQRIRAERRREILEAAVPIFAARGYSQAGISEIAQAAGVSHGAVFLHFRTKEELFRAAVLDRAEELEHALSIPDPQGQGIREALERMVNEQVAVVIHRRVTLQLLRYVVSQMDRFPDLAELVALGPRFAERIAPLLEEGARRGDLAPGRPLIAGTAYLAYLFGLSQVVLIDANSPAWPEYAERGLRILGAL